MSSCIETGGENSPVSNADGTHAGYRRLVEVWRSLPATPSGHRYKSDFNPMAFGPLLSRVNLYERLDDGRITFRVVGSENERLMGRGLIGQSILELLPESDRPFYNRIYTALEDVPCLAYFEQTARFYGGRTFDAVCYLAPLADEEGWPRYFLSVNDSNQFRILALIHEGLDMMSLTCTKYGLEDLGHGVPSVEA